MLVNQINYKGMDLKISDDVVFNHIVTYDNEFNGRIKRIQIRKNSYSPLITITRKIRDKEEDLKIQAYMVIRKGSNSKGLSTIWD